MLMAAIITTTTIIIIMEARARARIIIIAIQEALSTTQARGTHLKANCTTMKRHQQ